jgi:hypothetical protein
METKDRLISDLALENAQLRINLMECNYEIERLGKEVTVLQLNMKEALEGGDANEKHDVQLPTGDIDV